MKKPSCIICGKALNDGIIIDRKGICRHCEEKLINEKPDTDFYEYYKFCIRKNIASNFLKREGRYCLNYRL
ncbi:MAG: sigma factor G inhibitor Gin [Solirubrobacterales bacterium]